MHKIAIIDLGTNIFYLRILGIDAHGQVQFIDEESRFVRLAEAGLEKIGPAPFARGLATLHDFAQLLALHQPDQTIAIGTAALRTASNGGEFLAAVAQNTGLQVTRISGAREAQLIYRAVKGVIPNNACTQLIMDIGGGSVEFVIAQGGQVRWAQSFLVGLAVMYPRFHQGDAMTPVEQDQLRVFLEQTLGPLREVLATHRIDQLIGTMGTFEVVEQMLGVPKGGPQFSYLPLVEFAELCQRLVGSTAAERVADPALEGPRSQLIVVGLVLIRTIVQWARPATMVVTSVDLKDGLLAEILEAWQTGRTYQIES